MSNNLSTTLPSRKGLLINESGYSSNFTPPICVDIKGKYINTLYRPNEITSDWASYKKYLKKVRPDFCPIVTFVGHDESEIENITLMSLGGVVCAMNGFSNYALLGDRNIHFLDDIINNNKSEWIGFNVYTGFEGYVFNWIKQYKIRCAKQIFKKEKIEFEEADYKLKQLLKDHKGPVYEQGKLIYAPVIIGGHYNNYSYADSYENGADYVVRGKGINLLRDILLQLYAPGIYHDPMPYANIPLMDRDGFYRDTYNFSDHTKKYAKSKIKSVLTALGCSYSCTYCYIGSLIENLNEAYQDSGIRPPSIIQDRPIDVVLKEGEEILRLDKKYGVKTKVVFDQADISLNNIEWWEELSEKWMEKIKIQFYIQARPAMLAGKSGKRRIEIVNKYNLVSGISMAIESGDEKVRELLLDRHEKNKVIIKAVENINFFNLPLRTQAIVGLPVMKPKIAVNRLKTDLSLVDKDGTEYYYEDPLQESLKTLELVCSSEFKLEDYYWNAIYSPFPGTPLGDYSVAAGFASEYTANEAFLFSSESKLNCFDGLVAKRQVAFTFTSNYFAHMKNGGDLMRLFIYGHDNFDISTFANFIDNKHLYIDSRISKEYSESIITNFIQYAYSPELEGRFIEINLKLLHYYSNLMDGVVLAAKVASQYFKNKASSDSFDLYDLYKVERNHYYDNSYSMAYIPEEYLSFFVENFDESYLSKYDFH